MKTHNTIAVALMVVSTSISATAQYETVTIGGDKEKDLFVMKAKKLVGGKVEVYSASGELITAQPVQRKKMIIDFGTVMSGTYIIRVVKGTDTREYQYTKR